jgi:hypothetical protein
MLSIINKPIMLSVIMLRVVMLSVIMLSGVMLSIAMPLALHPNIRLSRKNFNRTNAKAYFVVTWLTKKKSLITFAFRTVL